MNKKILIIGANGFTGRHLLHAFAQKTDWQITGCSLHPDICPPACGYRFIQTDITHEEEVEKLMEEVQPDVVVHTAAMSATDYAETHHAEAQAVNVEAVRWLAQSCEKHHCRLIHLSTDFVFGGDTSRLYTEADTPSPVNYYGRTKWESEKVVASLCRNYAIARIVVVYGAPYPGQHGNIVSLVINRLQNHQEIRVADDQWRTPTYAGDVVQGVEKLIEQPVCGIYHICGGECMTVADMALRTADTLGLDRSLILPVHTAAMQEKTPRPRFSGLSIEKARREVGYRPLTFEEGVRSMLQDDSSRKR